MLQASSVSLTTSLSYRIDQRNEHTSSIRRTLFLLTFASYKIIKAMIVRLRTSKVLSNTNTSIPGRSVTSNRWNMCLKYLSTSDLTQLSSTQLHLIEGNFEILWNFYKNCENDRRTAIYHPIPNSKRPHLCGFHKCKKSFCFNFQIEFKNMRKANSIFQESRIDKLNTSTIHKLRNHCCKNLLISL